MCERIRHRGPDDQGVWTGPGVGLGHRRLSIIDLSAAGRQPMCNEDQTVWLVFNGEIYNFRELREELRRKGHHFRSKSDAEVIVHLYEETGDACVERLHGMFAFAVWDSRKRRLLLARDRVGKKPLKYAQVPDGLVFASELKAILRSDHVAREVEYESLDRFLSLGYTPSPFTGFRQIRKLPAAHRLIWEEGGLRLERYWQIDFSKKRSRTQEEWKDEVRECVQKAVQRRLVSDVPIGALLSGGIDSTIVVACMARALDKPVKTFSIGFDHEKYNELPFARAVAKAFETEHHEFIVRAETASLLSDIATLYEEPFADPSALPSFYLAREARRFVKVALNGDGGDEGFAGYARYARLQNWSARMEWPDKLGLSYLLNRMTMLHRPTLSPWGRRLDAVGHMTHPDVGVRYGWMVTLFSGREKAALYTNDFRSSTKLNGYLVPQLMHLPQSGANTVDRMLFADTMCYLPDDLLAKMDLATMGNGLEGRSPLLDHELLELAASAPADLKLKSGQLKWLLRTAFRDLIPKGIVDRSKKGFGIPLDDWFRGPLAHLLDDLILAPSARIHDFLRPAALREVVRQHRSHQAEHGRRLWALVMLELWWRQVVEGR